MRRLTCLIPPVPPLTYDCTLFEHQKFRRVRQPMSYLAPAFKEPNFEPSFHSMDITAAHKSATFPGNLEAWFPDYSIIQRILIDFSAACDLARALSGAQSSAASTTFCRDARLGQSFIYTAKRLSLFGKSYRNRSQLLSYQLVLHVNRWPGLAGIFSWKMLPRWNMYEIARSRQVRLSAWDTEDRRCSLKTSHVDKKLCEATTRLRLLDLTDAVSFHSDTQSGSRVRRFSASEY